jgi:ribosomal protein S18 acetylase RimI-like enzyme
MIRLLGNDDTESYRELRLASLTSDPDSFLSTHSDEKGKASDFFRQKIIYATKLPIWGFWGYFENSRLVGYSQTADGYFYKKRHIAYLYEVYVIPEFRRKGIASNLVNYIIDKLKSLPEIEKIELKVNSRNKNAIGFYEKIGFNKVAVVPSSVKEPDGSYQDEYIYNLQLI